MIQPEETYNLPANIAQELQNNPRAIQFYRELITAFIAEINSDLTHRNLFLKKELPDEVIDHQIYWENRNAEESISDDVEYSPLDGPCTILRLFFSSHEIHREYLPNNSSFHWLYNNLVYLEKLIEVSRITSLIDFDEYIKIIRKFWEFFRVFKDTFLLVKPNRSTFILNNQYFLAANQFFAEVALLYHRLLLLIHERTAITYKLITGKIKLDSAVRDPDREKLQRYPFLLFARLPQNLDDLIDLNIEKIKFRPRYLTRLLTKRHLREVSQEVILALKFISITHQGLTLGWVYDQLEDIKEKYFFTGDFYDFFCGEYDNNEEYLNACRCLTEVFLIHFMSSLSEVNPSVVKTISETLKDQSLPLRFAQALGKNPSTKTVLNKRRQEDEDKANPKKEIKLDRDIDLSEEAFFVRVENIFAIPVTKYKQTELFTKVVPLPSDSPVKSPQVKGSPKNTFRDLDASLPPTVSPHLTPKP